MTASASYRLVTRSDFDGLVCAVLLKQLGIINEISFVHPKDMQDGKVAITDRDITTRCTAAGASLACLVEDYMSPAPIETVYPESPIISALDIMKRRQVRRLPVVDIDETVLGMITQADVARHLATKDPQAVAELMDSISQPAGVTV